MAKNQYRHKNWERFREEIIEADGFKCTDCGRSRPEVILQVHHKEYIPGRPVWDYPPELCETLCKGCHAREHGEIRPAHGWDLTYEEDLGGLWGNCELCKTEIRYVFHVHHPNWEPMLVGTVCCDSLTGTVQATEYRKKLERQKRFVNSKKWKGVTTEDSSLEVYSFTPNKELKIEILGSPNNYHIRINGITGQKTFTSLEDAKLFIFELRETGIAQSFASNHPIKQDDG